MFTSLSLKEWLEAAVALSVLIGGPLTLMQRYINKELKDLRKEMGYDLDRLSSNFKTDLLSEVSARKESMRHSIDEALFCLDTQIENNAMKIEQTVAVVDFLKKEIKLKDQSFKEKYLNDINFIVSLIDSIESYLETKNGYRRRKTNYSNINQETLSKDMD